VVRPGWIRLAVALVSAAVIVFELALMRAMSLRFWSHFAHMIISVALLGFGASGTALTLLRRQVDKHRRGWLCALTLAFALCLPLCVLAAGGVRVDAQFLAWDLSQLAGVAALELLLLVPFFLAAGVIGVALTDRPERVSGHYAASLVGSGLGGAGTVALMGLLGTGQLLLVPTALGMLALLALLPYRRVTFLAVAAVLGGLLALFRLPAPHRVPVSQYKMLPQVLEMPGSRLLHRAEGPLGRIDVVAGPAIHFAPGLSLQYSLEHTEPIPPHVLLILDGDATCPVYDVRRRRDWAFLDHTTAAVGYHLQPVPRALILGAGGGAEIGLALYHSSRVVALEMNRQIIDAMNGPLAGRGGRVYTDPNVTVLPQEARGYLASDEGRFDVIQLPAIDAFGASGAGLAATQESYLYTVEAFGAMLDHLADRGVLCVTRWARTPPRDGLRVFATAAEALRRRHLEPAAHLAMIRSWATVTVLASRTPLTSADADAIRRFCRRRSFDLCYLPNLPAAEANRFHVLDRPYFFEGTHALLGPERHQYLRRYLFQIDAPTDDRPYFFHFFKWQSLGELRRQLGRRSRAFLEMGYVLLLAALGQAIVLAAALILLPLAPGMRSLRSASHKCATLGYFLALGAGFMLLEMSFLQKLILYLAHPVYSAAAVISAFLIFAGIGSRMSRRLTAAGRQASLAGVLVVVLSVAYVLVMDVWLTRTQSWALPGRLAVATVTIAPLAVAMGHMFPLGLRQVGTAAPALVPWAWAVNGFASVIAAVAAALIAMAVGLARLTLVAVACYALAAVLARRLPGAAEA
jgi:spermidine synthase